MVKFSADGSVLSLEDKPGKHKSRSALTSRYFYDHTKVVRAQMVAPAERGEIEITDHT